MISLHDISVPVFGRYLERLDRLVEKSAAYIADLGLPEVALLSVRALRRICCPSRRRCESPPAFHCGRSRPVDAAPAGSGLSGGYFLHGA